MPVRSDAQFPKVLNLAHFWMGTSLVKLRLGCPFPCPPLEGEVYPPLAAPEATRVHPPSAAPEATRGLGGGEGVLKNGIRRMVLELEE
jgi:hypothetical protein